MPSLRRLSILLIVVIVYVFQVERVHPAVFFGQLQDDSIYFSTAKALADGEGYKLISFPGAPPQTKYPVIYPWLLSYVWKLNPNFPANLSLAIRLTECCGCITLFAVFFLLRKLPAVGETAALYLTAVCALQPAIVRASGLVMSDIPFMACLLTALALSVPADADRDAAWKFGLAGLIAGLSVGIRTVGAVLVAGIFCALFYSSLVSKRSFRPTIIFAVAAVITIAVVMAPVMLQRGDGLKFAGSGEPGWDQVAAYYTSYTRFQWGMGVPSFASLVQLVLMNAFVLAASPGPILVGNVARVFGKTLFFAAMLLAFPIWIGLNRQARYREWRPALFTLLFYISTLLVWPYPSPERFLLPILPILLAGLWCELRRIVVVQLHALRGGAAAARAAVGVLCILLFTLFAVAAWNVLVADPRARKEGAGTLAATLEQREQGYRWLREHSDPRDRVAAWQDAVLYLYTGRQSLRPIAPLPQAIYADDVASETRDLAHICDAPRHSRVRYWMTEPDDFRLESHRERFIERMAEMSRALPVVFQSSEGSVRILDASCLMEQERPDCQAVQATLFPK